MANDVEYLFISLSSFVKYDSIISLLSTSYIICFLLLSFESYLYAQDTSLYHII